MRVPDLKTSAIREEWLVNVRLWRENAARCTCRPGILRFVFGCGTYQRILSL